MKQSRFPRAARRGPALASGLLLGVLACRESSKSSGTAAPLTAGPERFSFTLPTEYVARELRGEGSETLRVPPDARFEPIDGGVRVEAGSAFAIDILFGAAPLAELPLRVDGAVRVLQEEDLVVFRSGTEYWFVVLRELVPEWDEDDRRRVSCGSVRAMERSGQFGSDVPRFPRSAVERMVATCRSLALPRLE